MTKIVICFALVESLSSKITGKKVKRQLWVCTITQKVSVMLFNYNERQCQSKLGMIYLKHYKKKQLLTSLHYIFYDFICGILMFSFCVRFSINLHVIVFRVWNYRGLQTTVFRPKYLKRQRKTKSGLKWKCFFFYLES